MQDRVERVSAGFDLLERLSAGSKEHQCFICSPGKPKFAKGWRVRLHVDGSVVLVGHECGRRYLGVDYQEQVRLFEAGEREERLRREKAAILSGREVIEQSARTTIEDRGLDQVMAIKQAFLDLHPQARQALERAAAGAYSDVFDLEVFAHGSPRTGAREVMTALLELERAKGLDEIEAAIRALRRAADDHNRMVRGYGDGQVRRDRGTIRRLNQHVPLVDVSLQGNALILRRHSDGLERRLPWPACLRLELIEVPRPGPATAA